MLVERHLVDLLPSLLPGRRIEVLRTIRTELKEVTERIADDVVLARRADFARLARAQPTLSTLDAEAFESSSAELIATQDDMALRALLARLSKPPALLEASRTVAGPSFICGGEAG